MKGKEKTKAPRAIAGLFHATIPRPVLSLAKSGEFSNKGAAAMKYGLVVLATGLMSMALATCRPVRVVPHRISVTSLSLNADASDPAYTSCQSFVLTHDDVAAYFRLATEVGGLEFHDRAVILPCQYEGTLTLDGEAWKFSINAGGAGYLYKADETQRRYLCERRCHKALARVFGGD